MTEIKQNFSVTQGDVYEVTITVKDENGVAKDLTGATKRWAAFNSLGVAVISKADVEISLVRVNGGVGELDALRFNLAGADTVSLAAANYRHEAETVDVSSNRSTVTKGIMKVEAQLLV